MLKHSHPNEYPYNISNLSSELHQINSITNKSYTPCKTNSTYEKENKKNINKSLSPNSKGEPHLNKNMITTTAITTITTTTTTTTTTNIALPVEGNIEIIYDKSPFKKNKDEIIATPKKKSSKGIVGLKLQEFQNRFKKHPIQQQIRSNKLNNSSTEKLKSKNNSTAKTSAMNPPNLMNPHASGANNRYMINYYNSKHSNSGHSALSQDLPIKTTSQGSQQNLNLSKDFELNNSNKNLSTPHEITFNVNSVFGGTPDNHHRSKKVKDLELPNHEPTKFSFKKNGVVKAYAVNTNQGIVRNYNEDRVSIILNIMKPIDRQNEFWPRCSFFGVYDGHGGVTCADFLRDNLHHFVIKDENFPYNPKEALRGGFAEAERQFCELSQKNFNRNEGIIENNEGNNKSEIKPMSSFDKSGSCCIVLLIVGDTCYIANVGDSRSVMSVESGRKAVQLSRDHKPLDEIEYKRINEGGGKIYQTKVQTHNNANQLENGVGLAEQTYLVGPYRVLPGRLSVTRTFGDIEAKLPYLGGNPKVVVAVPDITCFKVCEEHDFAIIASDGIFDKLSTKEVVDIVWNGTKENLGDNIHQVCATAVEHVMKTAIAKRTVDNITVVMISFSSFKNYLFPKRPELIGHNSLDNINVGRKQYILDNSLIANNSFDLDNRSFSLGEELNIVNVDEKNQIIDINNDNPLNKNNLSNNSKNPMNKRTNIKKKKTNVGIGVRTSIKSLIPNGIYSSHVPVDKIKTTIITKIPNNKINGAPAVKKNDVVYNTSRGLTKNMDTFYKKK